MPTKLVILPYEKILRQLFFVSVPMAIDSVNPVKCNKPESNTDLLYFGQVDLTSDKSKIKSIISMDK